MKLNHSSKCVLEICTKGRCYSQVIISLWILLEKNLYLLSCATKWQKITSMIKNPSTVHINIPPTLKSTQPYSLDPKRSSIASLYLKAIEYNTHICTFCIYSTPAWFSLKTQLYVRLYTKIFFILALPKDTRQKTKFLVDKNVAVSATSILKTLQWF